MIFAVCAAVVVSAVMVPSSFAQEKVLKGEVVSGPSTGQVYQPTAPMPKGPKKAIAVADFENKTSWEGQWSLGTGMSNQLITALIATGRFTVLEREDIHGILAEQDFGQSGRTVQQGGAQIGKIQKAQILVKGAVTEFATNTSDQTGGLNIKGFNIGGASSEAKVTVDIRIYDTTTSQVLDSQNCTGIAKAGGMAISYTDQDWGIGGSNFEKTPLGQATRQAIDQAVRFIVARMENVRWQGKIVSVKENVIFINHGKQSNIMVKDKFEVFKPGEELIDPDTGANLGSEETRIGEIEVVEVQDKFAKAVPVSGTGFDKGDIIRYQY
jgi:curli biogenesis system outer membrane secretion channel CsgG